MTMSDQLRAGYAAHIYRILIRFSSNNRRAANLIRCIARLESLPVPTHPLWREFYLNQLAEYKEELLELKARL
jgi:hypothetical protein